MKYITRLYSEVLNEVRQAKTEEEKLQLLIENKSEVLIDIFKYGFGNLDSPYRNGVPQYTPDDSPYGYSYSTLQKEFHRLSYFFNTKFLISNEKLRDQKLKNILEMLHFSEAALLENIFTKKLDNYVSKELVIKAYPELEKELV
jgi:hypothetical protein